MTEKSETKSDAYSDGYTHEALHTAHVIADMFDRHVLDTQCADKFPDVKAAADRAAKALYFVYQLIGQKFEDDHSVKRQGISGAQ